MAIHGTVRNTDRLVNEVQRRRLSVMFDESPPYAVSVADAEGSVIVGAEEGLTDWCEAVELTLRRLESDEAEAAKDSERQAIEAAERGEAS